MSQGSHVNVDSGGIWSSCALEKQNSRLLIQSLYFFFLLSLEKGFLGTVTLHLAWMDGKVAADFETTVDISRGGRCGGREDSQKPTSQATEANTANTADTVTPHKSSTSRWKETLQPVINTPAVKKYSQCSFTVASEPLVPH